MALNNRKKKKHYEFYSGHALQPYAVTIVDLGSAIYEETVNGIREMDEVVRVRVI